MEKFEQPEQNLNSEEFRDNLADTLKAIPDHDMRKEFLDSIRETEAYKETQKKHLEDISAKDEYETHLETIKTWPHNRPIEELKNQIPETLLADKDFVLFVLEGFTHDTPNIFSIASESLRQDKDIIKSAIVKNYDVLENIPKNSPIFDEKDFLLELCPLLKEAIRREVYGNFSFSGWPSVFKHASESLKADKDFVLKIISADPGINYSEIPSDLREDQEVMEAIFQESKSLKYASAEMRGDREIASLALKYNPKEFNLISEELKRDFSFFESILVNNKSGNAGWGYGSRDEMVISFWNANADTLGIKMDPERRVETFLGPRGIYTQIENLDLFARFISKFDGGSLHDTYTFSKEEKSVLEKHFGKNFQYKFSDLWRSGNEWKKFAPNFMKERQIHHTLERLDSSLNKVQIETRLRDLVEQYSH